jgi:hydrogenase expression/formation protein HypE
VLAVMSSHPLGREARVIGEVVKDHPGRVVLKTGIGGTRIVDMLSGEQLPRIC